MKKFWIRTLIFTPILGLTACGGGQNIKPDGGQEEAPTAVQETKKTPVWHYGKPDEGNESKVKVVGVQTPEQLPEGQSLGAEELPEEDSTKVATQVDVPITFEPIIYFDYDNDVLSEEAVKTVQHYAQMLLDDPMKRVRLLGYTDERGTPDYNLALAERRAKAVEQVMVVFGVNPDRIEVISYGEEKPAVEGHNEAAWAKNRRVEIVIY